MFTNLPEGMEAERKTQQTSTIESLETAQSGSVQHGAAQSDSETLMGADYGCIPNFESIIIVSSTIFSGTC